MMGRYLIHLNEDRMGNVTLTAVSKRVQRQLSKGNAYDGAHDVFIQEAHVADWVGTLPRAAFYGRGKNKRFNDGARFYMDAWTFEQMVGGR